MKGAIKYLCIGLSVAFTGYRLFDAGRLYQSSIDSSQIKNIQYNLLREQSKNDTLEEQLRKNNNELEKLRDKNKVCSKSDIEKFRREYFGKEKSSNYHNSSLYYKLDY